MLSPFPGMDPYIERSDWEDFHARMINTISDSIIEPLGDRYLPRIERRIYVDSIPPDAPNQRVADVGIVERPSWDGGAVAVATAPIATIEPVTLPLPRPVERREAYLEIRLADSSRVVTNIELLSPANKRPGSEGLQQYTDKRDAILRTTTHLVEIDLLLAGQSWNLPQMPPGDYAAFVARGNRRSGVDVYRWKRDRRLPTIPIPLIAPDPDVPLDLQSVFNTVYQRARYDRSIDYNVG